MVIGLVISNRPRASSLSYFEITWAITPWIVLHSVQLLLLITLFYYLWCNNDSNYSHLTLPIAITITTKTMTMTTTTTITIVKIIIMILVVYSAFSINVQKCFTLECWAKTLNGLSFSIPKWARSFWIYHKSVSSLPMIMIQFRWTYLISGFPLVIFSPSPPCPWRFPVVQ